MKQEVQVEAVIYKLREKQITIACEEYPENLQNYPVFSLLKFLAFLSSFFKYFPF
jgi:hypothetical protein